MRMITATVIYVPPRGEGNSHWAVTVVYPIRRGGYVIRAKKTVYLTYMPAVGDEISCRLF
jgi:hypothetical protein